MKERLGKNTSVEYNPETHRIVIQYMPTMDYISLDPDMIQNLMLFVEKVKAYQHC